MHVCVPILGGVSTAYSTHKHTYASSSSSRPLANTVTLNFRKHKMPLSVFVGKQFPINLRRRMPHRQYVQMHPKGATNQVGGAGRQRQEAGGRWKGAKALPCSKSFARALIAFLANMKMYSRHASSHFANVPPNESHKSEREREREQEKISVCGGSRSRYECVEGEWKPAVASAHSAGKVCFPLCGKSRGKSFFFAKISKV